MRLFTVLLISLLFGCASEKQSEQSNDKTKTIQSGTLNKTDINQDYDTSSWTEFSPHSHNVILDLRYATTNNFTERKLYDCGRCFLSKTTAIALDSVIEKFGMMGLKPVLLDCYRPVDIQKRLWEIVPDPNYVADPARGSTHNRGISVDLTLADSLGRYLEMGTEYDHFGKEAHHDFTNLPQEVLNNRELLRSVMESFGFVSTRTEWWHYHYGHELSPLQNMRWKCP